jgi:hypothetical protein
MILESEAAFYVALPDPGTGVCPRDTGMNGYGRLQPVYGLWNRRAGTYRYTVSAHERDSMYAKGWIPEGFGAEGVAFCTTW